MDLNKECANKIFNLIVEKTSLSDNNIINQKDFDTNTFDIQPILISEIVKECIEFSPEEIKSVLHILENENLISMITNENTGRLEKLLLTPNGCSKAFRNSLDSCIL